MRKLIIANLLIFMFAYSITYSQDTLIVHPNKEIITMGMGVGFDYGGIGCNLSVYPAKFLGFFGGFGYAFAGPGYNVGIKLRAFRGKPKVASPFITAMYGYNTAIIIDNQQELNKFFYGLSAGFGIDTKYTSDKLGYWSFAILIPIRGPEVDDYIFDLKYRERVEFKNELLSFGISLGYKVVF